MKILVACEYSGVVREAFRKAGHEAYSCDLLPSEDNSEFHVQGDVLYKKVDGVLFGKRDVKENERPVWGNQTPSGQNKLGPSETRWKERSRTYQGIANAMAQQWGSIR